MLNQKEFKGVTERVNKLRIELEKNQKKVKSAPTPQILRDAKKDIK